MATKQGGAQETAGMSRDQTTALVEAMKEAERHRRCVIADDAARDEMARILDLVQDYTAALKAAARLIKKDGSPEDAERIKIKLDTAKAIAKMIRDSEND